MILRGVLLLAVLFAGCTGGSDEIVRTTQPPFETMITTTPAPITAAPQTTEPYIAEVFEEKILYESNGVKIPLTIYRPKNEHSYPAVIVLHTSGGLSNEERDFAESLSKEGYVAVAVDYFSPFGITSSTRGLTFSTYWNETFEALNGVIDYIKSQDYADSEHIGAIGFSIGGYWAFILGTTDDVDAVVTYYGVYSTKVEDWEPKMQLSDAIKADFRSPVLILHGGADDIQNVSAVYKKSSLMSTMNKEYEMKIYDGVGHSFDRSTSMNYNKDATEDAWNRTVDFLDKHL